MIMLKATITVVALVLVGITNFRCFPIYKFLNVMGVNHKPMPQLNWPSKSDAVIVVLDSNEWEKLIRRHNDNWTIFTADSLHDILLSGLDWNGSSVKGTQLSGLTFTIISFGGLVDTSDAIKLIKWHNGRVLDNRNKLEDESIAVIIGLPDTAFGIRQFLLFRSCFNNMIPYERICNASPDDLHNIILSYNVKPLEFLSFRIHHSAKDVSIRKNIDPLGGRLIPPLPQYNQFAGVILTGDSVIDESSGHSLNTLYNSTSNVPIFENWINYMVEQEDFHSPARFFVGCKYEGMPANTGSFHGLRVYVGEMALAGATENCIETAQTLGAIIVPISGNPQLGILDNVSSGEFPFPCITRYCLREISVSNRSHVCNFHHHPFMQTTNKPLVGLSFLLIVTEEQASYLSSVITTLGGIVINPLVDDFEDPIVITNGFSDMTTLIDVCRETERVLMYSYILEHEFSESVDQSLHLFIPKRQYPEWVESPESQEVQQSTQQSIPEQFKHITLRASNINVQRGLILNYIGAQLTEHFSLTKLDKFFHPQLYPSNYFYPGSGHFAFSIDNHAAANGVFLMDSEEESSKLTYTLSDKICEILSVFGIQLCVVRDEIGIAVVALEEVIIGHKIFRAFHELINGSSYVFFELFNNGLKLFDNCVLPSFITHYSAIVFCDKRCVCQDEDVIPNGLNIKFIHTDGTSNVEICEWGIPLFLKSTNDGFLCWTRPLYNSVQHIKNLDVDFLSEMLTRGDEEILKSTTKVCLKCDDCLPPEYDQFTKYSLVNTPCECGNQNSYVCVK